MHVIASLGVCNIYKWAGPIWQGKKTAQPRVNHFGTTSSNTRRPRKRPNLIWEAGIVIQIVPWFAWHIWWGQAARGTLSVSHSKRIHTNNRSWWRITNDLKSNRTSDTVLLRVQTRTTTWDQLPAPHLYLQVSSLSSHLTENYCDRPPTANWITPYRYKDRESTLLSRVFTYNYIHVVVHFVFHLSWSVRFSY